jgi:VanZ family protein
MSITRFKYFIIFAFVLTLLSRLPVHAQTQQNNDSINKKRLRAVIIGSTATYAASMVVLYYAWYKDNLYPDFNIIDDSDYWLQLDKLGHLSTTYTLSNYGYWMLRWSGVNEKKSIWYGALMGWGAMTLIEILDGFSNEYGASWADLTANTLGAGLFVGQQFLWHEQRFRMKFSYHPTEYAQYNPGQLGENSLQRILKDYNGHTYWLSASIGSFIKKEHKFPDWICVSGGYGGKGILAPHTNPEYDSEGLPHFDRVRQYYISMDIDWTKIKTNSGFLKFTFKLLSFIKLPFPTLEYNSEDGLVGHWIYF